MGKKNNAWNHYFRDKNRFADLFNGVFFDGERMIVPEELEMISEVYEQAADKSKGKRGLRDQRSRDIKMVMKSGEIFRLLALENQDKVNYAMPFRCMQYDTMEYSHQLNELQKKNMESADYQNTAERMGRFKKTDRLTPVYTLCLYHGEEPWDGPRCLKDMMEFGDDKDRMSMFFADYPMRLFCVNEQEDFGKFQSEIRKVFRLLKLRKDKRQLEKEIATNEEYRKVDIETLEVLSVMLDAPEIWENREKYMVDESEEEFDMCQAVQEIREEGREEGRKSCCLINIQSLMKNLNLTAKRAMDALEIPEKEQAEYLKML